MSEIPSNMRTQLLAGDVAALRRSIQLDCTTTTTEHTDNRRQDTTAIECSIQAATPSPQKLGLYYTYDSSAQGSSAALTWSGLVTVYTSSNNDLYCAQMQAHTYLVTVEDTNSDGKIDVPAVEILLTPNPIYAADTPDEITITTVDGPLLPPLFMNFRFDDGTTGAAPAVRPGEVDLIPDIIKAAEAQYQSELRAAGLLPE